MESKIELINEREQEELFEKLKFLYITRSNKHWKDQIPNLILLRKVKGINEVDLENKSDFEIFKMFYPNDTNERKNHHKKFLFQEVLMFWFHNQVFDNLHQLL